MEPKARGTFGTTAIGESRGIKIVDLFPRASTECNHGAVACRSGLLIEWFANPKRKLSGAVIFVETPTGRGTIPNGVAGHATRHADRRQRCVVEAGGSIELIGAEVDVGKHHALSAAK